MGKLELHVAQSECNPVSGCCENRNKSSGSERRERERERGGEKNFWKILQGRNHLEI